MCLIECSHPNLSISCTFFQNNHIKLDVTKCSNTNVESPFFFSLPLLSNENGAIENSVQDFLKFAAFREIHNQSTENFFEFITLLIK